MVAVWWQRGGCPLIGLSHGPPPRTALPEGAALLSALRSPRCPRLSDGQASARRAVCDNTASAGAAWAPPTLSAAGPSRLGAELQGRCCLHSPCLLPWPPGSLGRRCGPAEACTAPPGTRAHTQAQAHTALSCTCTRTPHSESPPLRASDAWPWGSPVPGREAPAPGGTRHRSRCLPLFSECVSHPEDTTCRGV